MTPLPLDDLLDHADFVRALTGDLVGAADRADDLAQEVWLRTLRTPPGHGTSPRGWLATVARRLASNQRRAERRRSAREAAAARAEAVPSPADVLAREQVRERLLRAVLALDEPFRSAVLLRYYEGLAPRTIARRLGVPAATVRGRVRRGLERLRVALDAQHGGDRSAWCLALAPWLRLRATEPAPASGLLTQVLLMKKAALPLVAAALLCGVLLVVFDLAPWSSSSAPRADSVAQSDGARAAVDAGTEGVAEPAGQERNSLAPVPSAAGRRVFPGERGVGRVHGSVIDADDRPVSGAVVVAVPVPGHAPPGLQIDDDRTARHTTTGDDGRFVFEGIAAGPTRIAASHPAQDHPAQDHATQAHPAQAHPGPRAAAPPRPRVAAATIVVGAARDEPPVRLRLQPAPDDEIAWLVVDAAGAAVAEATVELFAWDPNDTAADAAERSRREPRWRGVTGADGVARVRGVPVDTGVAFASTADGRVGSSSFAFGPHRDGAVQNRIELAAAGTLRVRLRGLPAERLADAVLSLHALAHRDPYWASGGRRFDAAVVGATAVFTGLAAGEYGVWLEAPSCARLVAPRHTWGDTPLDNSADMPRAAVAAGQVTELVLEVTAGGAIAGRVEVDGRAVEGARVRAVLAPATSNYPAGFVLHGAHVWRLDQPHENAPHHPANHRHAHSDARGEYALRGLVPGRYRLEVAADGLSFDRRMDVEVRDGATVELAHRLVPAGVLQVAVLGASYLGVVARGATAPAMVAITRDDFATFPGLAAGPWMVARFHSDGSVPPVPVGEGEVVAGRTTWLDLREASVRAVITGCVLTAGAPLPGVAVRLYPDTVYSNAHGAFRLRAGYPLHFRRGLGTHIAVFHQGLVYRVAPNADDPVTSLDFDVELGVHALAVELVDADGAPQSGSLRLSVDASADGESVVRAVEAAAELRVAGALRLAALPAGSVRGEVTFDDGPSVPIATTLPRDEPLRVVRPVTGTLRVLVTERGVAKAGATVYAAAWIGVGAAPDDDAAFFASAASTAARTGDDGSAVLHVAAGEVLVQVTRGWIGGRTLRARVVAGTRSELLVELD